MDYKYLGNTNIKVSQLGFGALTLSRLQKNLTYSESEYLLDAALEYGINFFDTSEFYDNYYNLSSLSKHRNKDIVVISKSYAYTKEGARKSVEKALRELKRDYIDVFCLHEQESALTLKGHHEAILELEKMKKEGLIRAVGISTHFIDCVKSAAENQHVEIIQAITNYQGVGIVDGTLMEMTKALEYAQSKGKGIYGMKVLGGGSLHEDILKSFEFIKNYPYIDAFALGIGDISELKLAVEFFNNNGFNNSLLLETKRIVRKVYVSPWCIGCAKCADKCSQSAISISDEKAVVDASKCILCGYCVGVCPELSLKIY